jgi:hypothetical protein
MNMKTAYLGGVLSGLLALLAASGLVPQSAQAAEPSTGTEEGMPYQASGIVEYINLAKDTIVISDRGMNIAADTPVYFGSRTASRNALRKGMHVGYKTSDAPNTRPAITGIWVLQRQ